MARKLTIVVTCTDRKTLPATPDLQVRTLEAEDGASRAREWKRQVRRAKDPGRPLRNLYCGEGWSAAQDLEAVARRAGYTPRLLVASAGLGLREVSSSAPAYAATFSPRLPDSVGQTVEENRAWWAAVCGLPSASRLRDEESPRVLMVLSDAYARSLHDDIAGLADKPRAPQILLFGGSGEIPGVRRVPADRTLRSHLGGTTNGMNARAAAAWIARDSGMEFWSASLQRSWKRFSASVAKSESYDREPLDDATVMGLIGEYRRMDPTISRTRALRQLRDSGRACEYSRFRALFEAATA